MERTFKMDGFENRKFCQWDITAVESKGKILIIIEAPEREFLLAMGRELASRNFNLKQGKVSFPVNMGPFALNITEERLLYLSKDGEPLNFIKTCDLMEQVFGH